MRDNRKWQAVICPFLVISAFIFGLTGCNRSSPAPAPRPQWKPDPAVETPPFRLSVDPKDRNRFDEIQNAPISKRAKLMITFLQERGHDITWYKSDKLVEVESHQTVQVIYFGSKNYMITWCSAALISDRHVVTAGHCNTSAGFVSKDFTLRDPPLDCRGQILFAYKPSPNAPITYHGCDKLRVQKYTISREDLPRNASDPDHNYKHHIKSVDEIHDYALFSIDEVDVSPVKIRPEFSEIMAVVDGARTRTAFGLSGFFGQPTLSLVVDPPYDQKNNPFLFHYRAMVGQIVDAYTFFDGWIENRKFFYVQGLNGITIPGNSGSPVYAQLNRPGYPFVRPNLGDSNWVFLSPLYGHQPINSTQASIYNYPSEVIPKMKGVFH